MFHSTCPHLIILIILAVAYQGRPIQTQLIAPDHSLTEETYIQKGLPANDRMWTGQDYAQAAVALKSLNDPTQLPRYGSPTSGAVFARMVSPENLKLSRFGTLTTQQRLAAATAILQNLGSIINVYAVATTQKRVFDTELVELMRYLLEVCREIVPLTESFFASLPADDPDHEARLKGREQMRQGMATIVSGSLTTLTEKEMYRSSELVRLAETVETTLPVILSFLPPGTQRELPVRLQRMVEQEADTSLKERLTRIVAALNKSKAG